MAMSRYVTDERTSGPEPSSYNNLLSDQVQVVCQSNYCHDWHGRHEPFPPANASGHIFHAPHRHVDASEHLQAIKNSHAKAMRYVHLLRNRKFLERP